MGNIIDKNGYIECPNCKGNGGWSIEKYDFKKDEYYDDFIDCYICEGYGEITWIEVLLRN